jgi:succinate dehydrogenase / fumarate reductase iron-sulfur subunit
MRSFSDGDSIFIEPWRATAFPVIKDLVVDRSALDTIIRLVAIPPATPVSSGR